MSHLTTKPTNWLCAQPRLRSDWADAQADPSLHWTNMFFVGFVVTRLIFTWKSNERTAKSLIRLGGCPGWSESLLDEHAFCWFCRDEAHIYLETWILLLQDAAWSLYTLSWVVLCWLFNYWSFIYLWDCQNDADADIFIPYSDMPIRTAVMLTFVTRQANLWLRAFLHDKF